MKILYLIFGLALAAAAAPFLLIAFWWAEWTLEHL